METFSRIAIVLLILSGVGKLVTWFAWRVRAYQHRSYIASPNDGGCRTRTY